MTQNIKPKTVDFNALVSKNGDISIDCQSKMIDLLNKEFTGEENRWYIANLYIYMNYHPTNDYPINLDTLVKLVGFKHKANAKRTLVNNFVLDEDYKILLIPKDEQVVHGGHNEENIMLNIDTFKNMCMLVKTEKSKEIRKYYVKLENIYNKIVKEEIENTKNLLEQKEQLLIQKDQLLIEQKVSANEERIETAKLLIQKDNEHETKAKLDRHKTLIEKLKNKKAIYLAQIIINNVKKIKIGSTKNIAKRADGLRDIFGYCIFLDAFEHEDYQTVEHNILHRVRDHLYKDKINDHISKEVVQLSDEFNYKQLYAIVKNCLDTFTSFTPQQKFKNRELNIEEQRLNAEHKRLNIISTLINNNISVHDIIQLLNNNVKENIGEIVEENEENIDENINEIGEENIDENVDENTETKISKQHLAIKTNIKLRKPKGQKILKIDPNNLKNVIKTYDSMIYLIRSDECAGFNKSGILKAIHNSRIYKGFRWNFEKLELKHTNEYKGKPPIREAILQVNEKKDQIITSFLTKDIAAKHLGITKNSMRDIIENHTKYDCFYYIEYYKCPKDLIDKYDKPIYSINSVHAQQIKQINPLTNTHIIFNNYNEIYVKLGISSKVIIDSIENNTLYGGCLWQYV
jgi:phage anti-repressor protein